MQKLSRRRLFSLAANVVSLTAAAKLGFPRIALADESDDSKTAETLSLLAKDLFPHDGLSDKVYSDIAGIIISQELSSTGNYEQIQEGVTKLNNLSGRRDWSELDDGDRLRILSEIESDPFFSAIYNRIKGILYLREEVWQLVGYGGNALQKGGYLTRGFNDIDWLD